MIQSSSASRRSDRADEERTVSFRRTGRCCREYEFRQVAGGSPPRYHGIAVFTAGLLLLLLTTIFPARKIPLFISGFAAGFCGMVLIRNFWPRDWGLFPLLTIAGLARILLLPVAHSDDLNRYLWEGKVQLHSMNPYQTAPADPRTENLRDSTMNIL